MSDQIFHFFNLDFTYSELRIKYKTVDKFRHSTYGFNFKKYFTDYKKLVKKNKNVHFVQLQLS
jgi:hypothetical protein